jgi:hypothetical protein
MIVYQEAGTPLLRVVNEAQIAFSPVEESRFAAGSRE